MNPKEFPLPKEDGENIRSKMKNKVLNELRKRIARGYQNIDLNKVEPFIEAYLKELKVIE